MLSIKLALCASMVLLGDLEAGKQPILLQEELLGVSEEFNQAIAQDEEPEEKIVDGVRLQAIEAHVVSYTNQERARNGLPPLQVDKELMTTAREHAAWMTRNRSMVHTSRPVAENIAMGQPHSGAVVRAWMNSPGHRANILNFAHRKIGVAAFCTESGTIYWCQQFKQ
jgi:uncharacterized protein YkwD